MRVDGVLKVHISSTHNAISRSVLDDSIPFGQLHQHRATAHGLLRLAGSFVTVTGAAGVVAIVVIGDLGFFILNSSRTYPINISNT